MSSIVVGVGNPLLGDDAVGLDCARQLEGQVDAEVKQAIAGGLELAEMIADYNFALIIDAFHGDGIREIEVDQYLETVANHDTAFPRAYAILSQHVPMPKVRVLGIGINDMDIREGLSEQMAQKLPVAVTWAKQIVEEEHERAC